MANKLFMTSEDIVNLDLAPSQYTIDGIIMTQLHISVRNGIDIMKGLANDTRISYPKANAVTNIKTMATQDVLYVYGDAVRLDEPAKLKLAFHW